MYLSPLDYCSEENADLTELLKSFGALTGEAVFEQRKAAAMLEPEPSTKEHDDGMYTSHNIIVIDYDMLV